MTYEKLSSAQNSITALNTIYTFRGSKIPMVVRMATEVCVCPHLDTGVCNGTYPVCLHACTAKTSGAHKLPQGPLWGSISWYGYEQWAIQVNPPVLVISWKAPADGGPTALR